MKTTHEKQASDFLEKTGCKMNITFKRNGTYFPGEKETRDVYGVEIVRGSRTWVFEFGNSIAHSEFIAVYGKQRYKIPSEMRTKTDHEIMRYLQQDFGRVQNDRIIRPEAPTFYDILACLQKYDPGSFEDFCSEFGYDPDSKRAEKIYNAVKDEYMNVCRIWNDDEIEELGEIQ